MAPIREVERRILLKDGRAVTVRVMDGLLIDHILILGMKAEGHRLITGEERFPTVDRKTKDYLIRIGVIQE